MDTVTKARIDAAKNVSRWVVQKTAEATGDMAGNKFADKITSAGEWKEDDKTKKIEDIYISPEKKKKWWLEIVLTLKVIFIK